jgi:type I restriction enzyme S subunit
MLTDLFSGKAFKKSEYAESGIRLLQIANVSFGRTLWDNLSYMPFSYLEMYPELVLNSGDILMALNRPILNGKLKITQLKQDDVPDIIPTSRKI